MSRLTQATRTHHAHFAMSSGTQKLGKRALLEHPPLRHVSVGNMQGTVIQGGHSWWDAGQTGLNCIPAGLKPTCRAASGASLCCCSAGARPVTLIMLDVRSSSITVVVSPARGVVPEPSASCSRSPRVSKVRP